MWLPFDIMGKSIFPFGKLERFPHTGGMDGKIVIMGP